MVVQKFYVQAHKWVQIYFAKQLKEKYKLMQKEE